MGTPQICNGCEPVQTEIDDSDQGFAAIRMRKKGHEMVACLSCLGRNDVANKGKTVQCQACDKWICNKCFHSRSPACKCVEQEDPWLMLDRLFEPSKEPKQPFGGLFDNESDDEEQVGMLGLLNL